MSRDELLQRLEHVEQLRRMNDALEADLMTMGEARKKTERLLRITEATLKRCAADAVSRSPPELRGRLKAFIGQEIESTLRELREGLNRAFAQMIK